MIRRLINKNSEKFLARWIVLAFDVLIVFMSYVLAIVLHNNFDWYALSKTVTTGKLLSIFIAAIIGFWISRSYTGIIRHTGMRDGYNILKANIIIAIILLFEGIIFGSKGGLYISRAVILIQFLLSVFLLIGARMAVKVLYQSIMLREGKSKKTKVTRSAFRKSYAIC